MYSDSKLVSAFPWPIIFKIKLLTEYDSVTQEVLLSVESIMQNAKQLQICAPFLACKMSKWYPIMLQVFSSICNVTVLIRATILGFSS
jgi:hypothetical protein